MKRNHKITEIFTRKALFFLFSVIGVRIDIDIDIDIDIGISGGGDCC